MAHAVAALGTTALTAAGCVWYLPALADLRAGADRPDSRRIAAAACLTGWAGAGVLDALLLVARGWRTPLVAAAVGAAATIALRLYAVVRRRREERETAAHWARLGPLPPPAGAGRSRRAVAAVVGCGAAAALAVAVLHAASGPDGDARWLTAAAPAAIMAVFLAAAATYAHASRRTAPATGRTRVRR
ncbi:hypothetical protein [Streptomyces similanensis]|uniref:Uncharacterized protein n=1 Tax=Streptomyces similanensis TaxID=1274988 RepID=A0ABP9L5I1_9ACTN